MAETRYVAFLDILGFKDFIENNSIEEIVSIYDSALEITKRVLTSFEEQKFFKEPGLLHMRIISDSILLWTSDTSQGCFAMISMTVKFFLQGLLVEGLPLRGAIAIGNLEEREYQLNSQSNNFMSKYLVGDGITKAYLMEESQKWSGCMVSDEAIVELQAKHVEGSASLEDFISTIRVLARYKVPMSKGTITEHHVIDWTHTTASFILSKLNEDFIRASFSKHRKRTDTWEVELIISNTLQFLNSRKINNSHSFNL